MSDTQTVTPVTIDVVSDVVCPWCFIGKRRLEKALALKPNIPVEVRYHPYFLNPWVPREGMSRDEYLTTKFGSPERYQGIAGRVAAAAASEGLTYAVDKMKRQPNTLDCHRLILWAQAIGKAAEMKQRLMDLYFTDGADLSDREVLVAAAASVGLDAGQPAAHQLVARHVLIVGESSALQRRQQLGEGAPRLQRPRLHPVVGQPRQERHRLHSDVGLVLVMLGEMHGIDGAVERCGDSRGQAKRHDGIGTALGNR